MENKEIPDQSAFLTYIWDQLPENWKCKNWPDTPPKMGFMMPSEESSALPVQPIDYWSPKSLGLDIDYAEVFKNWGVTDESVDWCIRIAQFKINRHIDTVCDLLKINVGYASYKLPSNFFSNMADIQPKIAFILPS